MDSIKSSEYIYRHLRRASFRVAVHFNTGDTHIQEATSLLGNDIPVRSMAIYAIRLKLHKGQALNEWLNWGVMAQVNLTFELESGSVLLEAAQISLPFNPLEEFMYFNFDNAIMRSIKEIRLSTIVRTITKEEHINPADYFITCDMFYKPLQI